METAAILHRRAAMGLETPRVPFGARCMMRLRRDPKDDFLPRAVPAICLGPSSTVPGAYVMLRETADSNYKMEVTGNVQIEGKRTGVTKTLFELLVGPPE